MKTPNNLEVFATHGSHTAPDEIDGIIRPEFNERLQLNYSDFATWELIEEIAEGQRLRPEHGRIAGDPNRALDNETLFRDNNEAGISQDFNGVPILTEKLTPEMKQMILKASHIPYHREATERLLKPHGNEDDRLVVFDVHDTGNLMLGENPEDDIARAKTFPPVVLGNLEGRSASNEMLDALANAFEVHFGLEPSDIQKNDPYKGGYFTQRYGNPDNPDLKNAANQNRSVIQVELFRGMFVDEKTQTVIKSAMEHFKTKIAQVFSEVAYGYGRKEV